MWTVWGPVRAESWFQSQSIADLSRCTLHTTHCCTFNTSTVSVCFRENPESTFEVYLEVTFQGTQGTGVFSYSNVNSFSMYFCILYRLQNHMYVWWRVPSNQQNKTLGNPLSIFGLDPTVPGTTTTWALYTSATHLDLFRLFFSTYFYFLSIYIVMWLLMY